VKLNRITNLHSGQGGGHGISTDASCLNHDGRRWNWLPWQTGFDDKPAAIDDSSSKIHAACWNKSSLLKIGPIVLCIIGGLISFEPVHYRKICKVCYVSCDLRNNETLIAGKDNSSMIAPLSTTISIRDFSIYMGREGVTSCNGINSAITSSGSSRTSGSTRTVGSGLLSFFAADLLEASGSHLGSPKTQRRDLWSVGSQARALVKIWAQILYEGAGQYCARRRLCKRNQDRHNIWLSFHQ